MSSKDNDDRAVNLAAQAIELVESGRAEVNALLLTACSSR